MTNLNVFSDAGETEERPGRFGSGGAEIPGERNGDDQQRTPHVDSRVHRKDANKVRPTNDMRYV